MSGKGGKDGEGRDKESGQEVGEEKKKERQELGRRSNLRVEDVTPPALNMEIEVHIQGIQTRKDSLPTPPENDASCW